MEEKTVWRKCSRQYAEKVRKNRYAKLWEKESEPEVPFRYNPRREEYVITEIEWNELREKRLAKNCCPVCGRYLPVGRRVYCSQPCGYEGHRIENALLIRNVKETKVNRDFVKKG